MTSKFDEWILSGQMRLDFDVYQMQHKQWRFVVFMQQKSPDAHGIGLNCLVVMGGLEPSTYGL